MGGHWVTMWVMSRSRLMALALVFALGCAVGVNETGDGVGGGMAGPGAGGFGGGEAPTSSTSSSTGGMGGDPAMGGMGGSAEGGGGGGSDCVFDSPNTCSAADVLSSIAGDENDPPVVRYGVTSKWFQIQIREEVGSVIAEDLSYTVTLTSAPGTDYDLIVHQGSQDGPPNCNATAKPGVDQGAGVETVHDSWNDDQGLGGEDDHVWLSIEVRYVAGSECDANAQWTLEIEGHT